MHKAEKALSDICCLADRQCFNAQAGYNRLKKILLTMI